MNKAYSLLYWLISLFRSGEIRRFSSFLSKIHTIFHVQHLIQLFPKGLIVSSPFFFLLLNGCLLFLPGRNVDLLHAMLFLQDALGGIVQVNFLLMGGPELFPASLPMDSVHLVNDGPDAADVFGEDNHVVKLLDPGGVGLGLGNKIIHSSRQFMGLPFQFFYGENFVRFQEAMSLSSK